MDNLIGSVIDRYRITELLGEGGMARVYKAVDVVLERNVAIKILLPERQGDEKFLARFDREAKALAQLSHPHIVKVMDYGKHEGNPYLVMEYVAGPTLNKRYELPMAWNQAFQILLPIVRALDSAHRNKIVHRDIKPSNILISDTGQPMLTDFGIVKLLEDQQTQVLTGTGVGIGTPSYMAPEQSQGRDVDARTDVYSLGVVLYELIAGIKPFTADTAVEVALKHLSETVPSIRKNIKSVPESVEQLVLKAMAKKPEDRFQSMQTLAQSMESILASNNAPAPQRKKPAAKPAQPKKGSLWIIGGLVLAALAVSAYLLLKSKTGMDPSPTLPAASVPTLVTEPSEVVETPTIDSSVQASPAAVTTVAAEATPTLSPTNDPGQKYVINAANASKVIELNRIERISTFNLVWSPDGKWIASGGATGVTIINAETLAQESLLNANGVIKSLAVSPNNQFIAGLTKTTITIWDAGTREQVASYDLQGAPMSLAFTSDGETLAVAMLDGKVLLIKTLTGEATKTILGNYGGWSVAISPDGTRLSAGTSQGALLWELPSGTWMPISTGQSDLIKSLVFSPNNKYLAAGSTNFIRIWDVETGKEVKMIELPQPGFGGNINALVFSPDGKVLTSGSDDFKIRLWDTSNWSLMATLKSHTSAVLAVTFSPDGKYLVSGAYEGIIRLWGLP